MLGGAALSEALFGPFLPPCVGPPATPGTGQDASSSVPATRGSLPLPQGAKLPSVLVARSGQGGSREGNDHLFNSVLQWLIPRLLKGQTFMLMNVNALSFQNHILPFSNLPHQPMKQQGLQAGLIRLGGKNRRGKASDSKFKPL